MGMILGKRSPLRIGILGHRIFTAIYKSSHLALGWRFARSRRDLPIPPLERLQLRDFPIHVCTFAQQRSLGNAPPCAKAQWLTWPLSLLVFTAQAHTTCLALRRQIASFRQDPPILDRLRLRFLPRHVCTFAQQWSLGKATPCAYVTWYTWPALLRLFIQRNNTLLCKN